MLIYILSEEPYHDNSIIHAACTTRKGAEACKTRLISEHPFNPKDRWDTPPHYDIHEVELEVTTD